MLTQKQHELLIFIHRRLSDTGVSPSFDEMKRALGLKSKSGIHHRTDHGLEERGFIRSPAPTGLRALEVVKLPEDAFDERPARNLNRVEAITARRPRASHPPSTRSTSPPRCTAEIAARPIEALREQASHVDEQAAGEQHYALEVDGDSRRDAGILDGDVVIIERDETADR